MFRTFEEAAAALAAHRPDFEARGVSLPDSAKAYLWEGLKRDYRLAFDALPTLATDPNSGIPSLLTTLIDPDVYKILFAPTKAAAIATERRKGTWTDKTAMFPVVEHTGEVTSYGDFNDLGRAGANSNWPQRQAYVFQTICEYGDMEVELAGLGRINWVSEVDSAAASLLSRYQNLSYFYGVAGLQNYGILTDPNLSAALVPAAKAYGGVKWINNGQPSAVANEVYADIQAGVIQLVTQTNGLVDAESKMVLAMHPISEMALKTTNSFGINVAALLKDNFKNLRIETAVQYGPVSATNPGGSQTGYSYQLFAEEIEGQRTLYAAFNEKGRAFPIVRKHSSWSKKMSSGSWGTVLRMPIGVVQMLGI